MSGADIVMCQFLYSNNVNDKFTCSDNYASGNGYPPLDTQNDIEYDSSTKAYSSPNKAALSVTFHRKLNTGDTLEDYLFENGFTMDAIWAFG